MPGPVPKRSEERTRRNKSGETTKVPSTAPAEFPPASEDWHEIAVFWYESLQTSGQAVFYQPSDVATARYIAEAMSKNLQAGRLSGQLFAAVMSAMTDLLTTEGARRRARMEIERAPKSAEPAGVTALNDYRKQLGL